MTVHAQLPYIVFSPDLCNRDDAGMMQDVSRSGLLQLHGGLACFNGAASAIEGFVAGNQQKQQILNNGTVFSDPQSELTCNNASGARKRPREESVPLPSGHDCSPALATTATTATLFSGAGLVGAPVLNPAGGSGISGVLPGQSRLLESATASTSGRLASSSSRAVAPLSNDLISFFYRQSLEIDTLCRLETERLLVGLEEARKRHCRGLLSSLEQQVAKRLIDKEAELENARRRNAELEEKLRQVTEENQIWFGMAKNNEAVVCSLRASLEQALLHSTVAGTHEGYGDSDGAAQSCCFEPEEAPTASRRSACRRCGDRDIGVLLLPCKHLCLCKDCEPAAEACPVCGEAKSACLQVFMC